MTLRLDMLRYFVALADRGALAEAAATVGRTPSAVSMMVRQFEDHLGASLFEQGRKSRLTPLGEAVLAEARRALDQFDRSTDRILALASARMGLVRLAVTPSVAALVLPPVLARFMAERPGVRIDLRDMDSASILAALETGEADIGLATCGATPTLDQQPYLSDRFGVVAPATSDLARDWSSLTWADMTGMTFLSNGLCDLITDPDFAPIRAAARLHVPNTAALLGLVRAGVGVALLPELVARMGGPDLAFLPLTDTSARRPLSLISQPETLLTPAARDLLAAIRAARPAEFQPG